MSNIETLMNSPFYRPDPKNEGVSSEEWLAGYFSIVEADVVGASPVRKGRWKNTDFMRLRDVALHLADPRPGRVILDVGCADGATMVYCGLQGATVKGIDINAKGVASANSLLRRFKVEGEAVVGDAMKLPFPDDHFDVVISSDFVEHITDDVKIAMFKEARRVLKPGGALITKTVNLSYLQLALVYKRMRAIARGRNPFKIVIPHTLGTDDPQHIGLATRWMLTRCLVEAGLLNYEFHYPPLRRFGMSRVVEVLSTEIPVARDMLCEDLFCRAYKPIALSHFPN